MEEILLSVINTGIDALLHEYCQTTKFIRSEARWRKSGKAANYSGNSHKPDRLVEGKTQGFVDKENPVLQGSSNLRIEQVTAEYRFFEFWFLCLSRTERFNEVFDAASRTFRNFAKTNKSRIFSHAELSQCFAGIGNYTEVTKFAMCLLTKAVVLKDEGRQSVSLESVAKLLNLAVKVVNVRKEQYARAKKLKTENEQHQFQIRNWGSIVAYLGMLLQMMTRLDE